MINKIPKRIHYCWFGEGSIPAQDQQYIESWKKYCPDYEIILWNESNYDITKNRYMKQAYDAKKWGFVPDYARLDIIYQHGGVYLDTDVELLKGLDDIIEENKAFAGFETPEYVNLGSGFGAIQNHPIIKEMRDLYDNLDFLFEDGSYNLIPSPQYQTLILLKHGLKQNNEFQIIETMATYPTEYFCPKKYTFGVENISENTISIHHYNGSWKDSEQLQYISDKKKMFLNEKEYDELSFDDVRLWNRFFLNETVCSIQCLISVIRIYRFLLERDEINLPVTRITQIMEESMRKYFLIIGANHIRNWWFFRNSPFYKSMDVSLKIKTRTFLRAVKWTFLTKRK